MLYVDIPSTDDIRTLATHREPASVSIYLPTTPADGEISGDRIELKNLAREAERQLSDAHIDKRAVAAITEELDDLVDDEEFWRFQAHSLAVFVTPENLRTFRVASAFEPIVMLSDRFHLKPLLRVVSFPNAAYVLALAENGVRVIEVASEGRAVLTKVDGLPKDAASAVGRSTVNDRSPSGRIQGSEGQKVLLRQYARKVDGALRPLLSGSQIPLILAASEPLASLYRSVNTYPHLAQAIIATSPSTMTESELANRARPILDELYRGEIAAWARRFDEFEQQGRATTDISDAARAATFGAIDSVLVDIDEVVPGTIDENSGAVTFAQGANVHSYGIVDEIARRTILAGGKALGVRRADIPRGQSLAAILRYAV